MMGCLPSRRLLRHAAMIAGASALAAVAAPFGTWGFEIGPRFLYWFGVISIGWVQWLLLVWVLHRATSADPWPAGVCGTVASFIFAGLMALEINLLDAWLPGAPGRSGVIPFLWLLGILLAFCWFAQLLVRFISFDPPGKPRDSDSGGAIPFLKRIPHRIAGDLLCLRTEDHYLRIHTAAGNDLILFRLKDAVETQRNLFETGLFTEADVIPDSLDLSARTVDIVVRVRERKSGYVEVGFGVGNIVGSRVTAGWGTVIFLAPVARCALVWNTRSRSSPGTRISTNSIRGSGSIAMI